MKLHNYMSDCIQKQQTMKLALSRCLTEWLVLASSLKMVSNDVGTL